MSLMGSMILIACGNNENNNSPVASEVARDFYWIIGSSNSKITLGQTRTQIERVLGEPSEIRTDVSIFELAGGLRVAYNDVGQAVLFETLQNVDRNKSGVICFLGLSIGLGRAEVIDILESTLGPNKFRATSPSWITIQFDSNGNVMYPVRLDSRGNTVSQRDPQGFTIEIGLHAGTEVTSLGIGWSGGVN